MGEYRDSYENDGEPTPEEWAEIEELILEEELEEHRENKRDDSITLNAFIQWCKENGMIW